MWIVCYRQITYVPYHSVAGVTYQNVCNTHGNVCCVYMYNLITYYSLHTSMLWKAVRLCIYMQDPSSARNRTYSMTIHKATGVRTKYGQGNTRTAHAQSAKIRAIHITVIVVLWGYNNVAVRNINLIYIYSSRWSSTSWSPGPAPSLWSPSSSPCWRGTWYVRTYTVAYPMYVLYVHIWCTTCIIILYTKVAYCSVTMAFQPCALCGPHHMCSWL